MGDVPPVPPLPPPARDVRAALRGRRERAGESADPTLTEASGLVAGAAAGAPPSQSTSPVAPGDVIAAVVTFAAMVVAGVPLGLLWAASSPRLDVRAVVDGSETAFRPLAAADVRFALLGVVFGLVAGIITWWRARGGGWVVPAALATGGLFGALLAGWIGHLRRSHEVLSLLPPRATDLAAQLVDFRLRAHGFYVVYPLVSLVAFAVLTGVTSRRQAGDRSAHKDPADHDQAVSAS